MRPPGSQLVWCIEPGTVSIKRRLFSGKLTKEWSTQGFQGGELPAVTHWQAECKIGAKSALYLFVQRCMPHATPTCL